MTKAEDLRAELDDWKHNIGLRAFTAPDADLATVLESLDARIRDAGADRDSAVAAAVEETAASAAVVRQQEWETFRASAAAIRTAATRRALEDAAKELENVVAGYESSDRITPHEFGRRVSELSRQWRARAVVVASPAVDETHVAADDSDDPEHIDDCPGCAAFSLTGHIAAPTRVCEDCGAADPVGSDIESDHNCDDHRTPAREKHEGAGE